MSTAAAQQYDQRMDAQRPKRVKVTVSLDPERLEKARKAVEIGYASSIREWFENALIFQERQRGWEDNWEEFFREMDETFGPVSEEAKAWAERVLADL